MNNNNAIKSFLSWLKTGEVDPLSPYRLKIFREEKSRLLGEMDEAEKMRTYYLRATTGNKVYTYNKGGRSKYYREIPSPKNALAAVNQLENIEYRLREIEQVRDELKVGYDKLLVKYRLY